MGVLTVASGKSIWRGYEYYLDKKVICYNEVDNLIYDGKISGSGNHVYDVHLDINHPRKTTCNCPHAFGKRIICKHAIALYFTIFPDEANDYYNQVVVYEEEEAKRQEEAEIKLDEYINSLTKDELRNVVYELLYDSPAWVWDRFFQEHVDW